MRANICGKSIILLILFVSEVIWAQPKQQVGTLVVDGKSGQAPVIQIEGHPYVDLKALAEITNASLSFKANRIVLTLPPTSVSTTEVGPPVSTDEMGLSREFTKAGIETIASMREWASPLAYAIQNGYQVTDDWVSGYREQAANALRMASVAVSTDADRSALQLLTNEFEAVREWSRRLVEARRSMDTAKYALSADALRNEPMSQKLLTCGRFLATMLGSGKFQDDPSCH
ncbi:MAG: hypothetical protein LAN83_17370 [Acidobacteriia bacterium]|nr:hypothetical protein [Terriglobia bacterium]